MNHDDESGLKAIAAAASVRSVAPPALCGPLRVEVSDRTFHDPGRSRDVPARIHLPVCTAPVPLVIFSHGLGGSRTGYAQLARAWASHGIAVVLPSHAGSDGAIFQKLRSPAKVMRAALEDTKNWEARPADISFVIDELTRLTLLGADEPLAGRFDLSRIGVGGHSFGAWTVSAVAGARVTFPGELSHRALADPRPVAFLAMSPTVYDERGQSSGSWGSIERPLLVMTGTKDNTLDGQSYEERLVPFRDLPAGDKWLLVIEGAEHLTFSGGTAFKPVSAPMERAIEEASLAFWDAELRADDRARALLQPASLSAEGVRVHVETK